MLSVIVEDDAENRRSATGNRRFRRCGAVDPKAGRQTGRTPRVGRRTAGSRGFQVEGGAHGRSKSAGYLDLQRKDGRGDGEVEAIRKRSAGLQDEDGRDPNGGEESSGNDGRKVAGSSTKVGEGRALPGVTSRSPLRRGHRNIEDAIGGKRSWRSVRVMYG